TKRHASWRRKRTPDRIKACEHPPVAPGPPLPRTVGRYDLLEELDREVSIVAYGCRDRELDRAVVMRAMALPPELSETERAAFEARFLDETRRVSRISHPGLVATLDCGVDEATGTLFVIEEGVAGLSLDHSLAPGKQWPWEEAFRLIVRVGRGLQE